jgi:phosphoglycolate phosphatase-like HAD superfamily hydrolase
MEWAIRRAVESGNIPDDPRLDLTPAQRETNSQVIRRIWDGQERFDDLDEPPGLRMFLAEHSPRLFRLYETVLNGACRDRNTADARRDPAKWRVAGSMDFLRRLHELGVVNYFVTGAVLYEHGGMFEEVEVLGFPMGPGEVVEALMGSNWDRKMPKDEVMRELCDDRGIDPTRVLVVGDGRTEIAAGVAMGSVTMSRLPEDADRLRQMHRDIGTHCILPDYTSDALKRLITR